MGGVIGGSLSTDISPSDASPQFNGVVSINTNGSRAAQLWGNGFKISTAVTQSASFSNLAIYILANNNNGSTDAYCANTVIKLAYVSSGFSDAEMASLHTIVTAYQTMLGRN